MKKVKKLIMFVKDIMGQRNTPQHKGESKRLLRTLQSNKDKEHNKKFGIKKTEQLPQIIRFKKEALDRSIDEEKVC